MVFPFGETYLYSRAMNHRKSILHVRIFQRIFGILVLGSFFLLATHFYIYGQDKSGFPDGYDAVQAAPGSHKVIFENEFVRVLEVTVPPAGSIIAMHHHRWPSFFLSWDTRGKAPHIRDHRPDGSVTEHPSTEEAAHAGAWGVGWMKPEPMHSIEVLP